MKGKDEWIHGHILEVISGLDEQGKLFLSTMDLIGAQAGAKDFVVAGTCDGNLYGIRRRSCLR